MQQTSHKNKDDNMHTIRRETGSVILPGMMTNEPWGSMATRQALRMLGVSAAEIPHSLQFSFSLRDTDCRFLLLSKILQSKRGKENHKMYSHGEKVPMFALRC